MLNNTITPSTTLSDAQILSKSSWEVVIEYALLTSHSDKLIETRIKELAEYFNFYGYTVISIKKFEEVIEIFLKQCIETEKIIEGLDNLDIKFKIARKENTYEEIKNCYNELPTSYSKKQRKSYKIAHRPITLLISAKEKLVEGELSQNLESQMEQLSINEFPMDEFKSYRKPSKSLYLKRSSPELMHHIKNFSQHSLKLIFSYLDLEHLKFTKPEFMIVGDFVILVLEIKSSQLRKLSSCISLEMGDEDISIRVLKPYKKFYNIAMSTILKYGLDSMTTLDPEDYVEALKHSMKDLWREQLKGPGISFYTWCKQQVINNNSKVFDDIRLKMKEAWKFEVIKKSSSFKRAKLDKE